MNRTKQKELGDQNEDFESDFLGLSGNGTSDDLNRHGICGY